MAKNKWTRKAIYFDLIEEEVKKIFGERNTSAAYRKIKRFMIAHGFEHRQYSGYISNDIMLRYEVENILRNLCMEQPWICLCTQKIDVMEIRKEYDYLPFIREYMKDQESQQESPFEQDRDEEWEEEEDEWEEER